VRHAICRAGLVSSTKQANLVGAGACCGALECTQETEQGRFANTCMMIVVASMGVARSACCDERNHNAVGCKMLCTTACFQPPGEES